MVVACLVAEAMDLLEAVDDLCVTCRRHVGNMSRHATQVAILGKHANFADILRHLMPDDTLATQIIVSCARL